MTSIVSIIVAGMNGWIAYDLFRIENPSKFIKILAWGNLFFSAANIAIAITNV